MTSAVRSMPAALAQRTTSTPSAVLTWATCTREPVCRASWASRAMMLDSATAGQPGQPEAAGQLALVAAGGRPGERRGPGCAG